jgi:hypothetical protein
MVQTLKVVDFSSIRWINSNGWRLKTTGLLDKSTWTLATFLALILLSSLSSQGTADLDSKIIDNTQTAVL